MRSAALVAVLPIVIVAACWMTPSPGPAADVPVAYEGYVSGIDVIATEGKPVVCLAFISKEKPPGPDEIQVAALEARLQSALESASVRGMKVEVSYVEKDGQKVLTRVRILDRGAREKKNN
jgi:hypothetical protein